MPASRRHHRALAVIVNCLGVLAAVPALPPAPRAVAAPAAPAAPAQSTTPIPTGMPAAPPAVAPTKAPPIQMSTPPVTVAVTAANTPTPGYRIDVRNAANSTVETTVRQGLPTGSRATTVTGGGHASTPIVAGGANEVTWRLRLPAQSTTTLHTALTATTAGGSATAPTCVYGSDGTRAYDCATATWTGPAAVPATKVSATPAWRRPPVLLAALAAALVIVGGGLAWWWRRSRQRGRLAPGGPAGGPTLAGGAGGPVDRGALYPRPAMPAVAGRRRKPPVWLMVGVAVAVLAGVIGAAGWTATRRVAAIDTAKQPTSGAWMGKSVSGTLGVPLRETAFEFTVYRVTCGIASLPVPKPGDRQCLATVGVRNLTPDEQTWHGQLQRAYLPGGNWVSADEDATRVANLGQDVFAKPVAAGSRVLLPLVFTVHGSDPPKQLELRSGVFSAGVRVDMP